MFICFYLILNFIYFNYVWINLNAWKLFYNIHCIQLLYIDKYLEQKHSNYVIRKQKLKKRFFIYLVQVIKNVFLGQNDTGLKYHTYFVFIPHSLLFILYTHE